MLVLAALLPGDAAPLIARDALVHAVGHDHGNKSPGAVAGVAGALAGAVDARADLAGCIVFKARGALRVSLCRDCVAQWRKVRQIGREILKKRPKALGNGVRIVRMG